MIKSKSTAAKSATPTTPFRRHHNHRACIRQAVRAAENVCQQNSLRFTGIRRRVLELIWSNHQPITAYNLLKNLRQEKHNAAAPTIYRALDFLVENNLAHRIESLNAFVGCDRPKDAHHSQFMICSQCQQVAELDEATLIADAIGKQARQIGFRVEKQTVEIMGVCPTCQ